METEKKQIKRIEILNKLGVLLEPWLDDSDQASQLNEQTNLLTEVGIDSVAILQLILSIEKEFNISIKDNELDSDIFTKMGNLINIIEGKINEAN